MAKQPKSDIEKQIDETDGDAVMNEKTGDDEYQPVYKVYPDAKIPISKVVGKMWKSRRDQVDAKNKDDGTYDAWDETISYYKNDQTGKKNRDDPDLPSVGSATSITGGRFAQTENLVFANVSALVPSIYAKNPDVSVHSPRGDADRPFTTCAQKLIRTLMQKRTAPGINLKPKARRGIVMTVLTNASFIEVGYTRREQSSEQAMQDLERIAKELQNAKDTKEIEKLEGQLSAIDEKIDLLQPSGPWTKVLHPKDVLIDPDAQLPDASDAKWIMIKDVYDTSFLNAVYRRENSEGQLESIYAPTHVIKQSSGKPNIAGHDEDITNFTILKGDDGNNHADYGYDNEHTFKRAQRTYVWKVWDRITRRVYMYHDQDWTWPIWVWDDPFGFDDFFPIAPLSFHTDPEAMYARGEVSYYLDQQDEINAINSQTSRMRHRVSNTLVYNKRVVEHEKDLINLVKPTDDNDLVGVSLPEGMKLADVVMAPPVPAVDYPQLFDKKGQYDAIDRVSGVPSVVQGVEYKTNTTNRAIESYESSSSMRLDEKIDAIEEQIGRVGYMVLTLCLQHMSKEEVALLIGPENANAWPGPMNAKDAQRAFSMTITGGSSLKPTSKVRKEQAKETAQILGQFGADNPAIVLVVLRMFARAFSDELILEPGDWQMITQSIEQQLAPPPPEAPPQQAGAGAPPAANQAGMDPRAIVQQVGEMFAKMPDDIRQNVGRDIAQGVPLEEILQKLQNTPGDQPPAQQPQRR